MSVLGTTKHSSCNQCVDTWHYSYIVLYFALNSSFSGAATLLCSLQMKSRQQLACDARDTFATHDNLICFAPSSLYHFLSCH